MENCRPIHFVLAGWGFYSPMICVYWACWRIMSLLVNDSLFFSLLLTSLMFTNRCPWLSVPVQWIMNLPSYLHSPTLFSRRSCIRMESEFWCWFTYHFNCFSLLHSSKLIRGTWCHFRHSVMKTSQHWEEEETNKKAKKPSQSNIQSDPTFIWSDFSCSLAVA